MRTCTCRPGSAGLTARNSERKSGLPPCASTVGGKHRQHGSEQDGAQDQPSHVRPSAAAPRVPRRAPASPATSAAIARIRGSASLSSSSAAAVLAAAVVPAPGLPPAAADVPDSVLIASTGVADSVIVVRAAGFSLSGGPIQRSVASVYCWITFHSSVPCLTGLRAMNWKESYWLGGMRFPDQRTTATRSPSFCEPDLPSRRLTHDQRLDVGRDLQRDRR